MTRTVQARDLHQGDVIASGTAKGKTVASANYSPMGGGKAFVQFTDGEHRNYQSAHRLQVESTGWREKYGSDIVPPAEGLDDEDVCPTCRAEILWDDVERMWFCPNTWAHL